MFTIDTTITDLKVREKNILKVLFSMNIHQVATPEMMLEDARSYVLFFRESKGKHFAYIALHLLTTNRKLYYSCSDNPFSDDQMGTVEDEALAFLEGLGAMIDEVDFANMSDSAQDRWLNEQDIFSEKPVVVAQSAEPVAPEAVAAPAAPIVAPPQPQPIAPPPAPEVVAAPAAPVAAPTQPQPITPPTPEVVAAPAAPITAPPQPQPITPPAPEVVAAPPQPQPIAPPQPLPVSPPVTPYVQPVLTPVHAEPVATPAVKPVVQTAKPAAPRVPVQQPKQQQKAAVKRQQEIMQQAVKANIVKSSAPPQSRETQSAPGVVSRDKEALARLLASF